MTDLVDIINLALQAIGTRTTVASLSENSNEAIQANLVIARLRDDLLRMAPWDCATNYASLTYITSTPGTPENPTAGTALWQKGQPAPPWAYEYQYPVDCLRGMFIVPQFTTGFASGIPITTAITGGSPAYWNGPPSRFKVSIDQFYSATAATVVAGGTGYAIGDQITLEGTPTDDPPIGAPAVLQVATVAGGVILTVSVVTNVFGSVLSGSYFDPPTNPIAQDSTTGSGTGATFNLTLSAKGDQRVILTNQEDALLCYVKRVTNPDVMDPLFIDAWSLILGSRLVMALTGDKTLANQKVAEANNLVLEARKADGNEGLTINDVAPDWLRVRGIYYPTWEFSPNTQLDWGPLFVPF